jgi:hypothetical protein
VVGVPGYRSRSAGSIPGVVRLERCPLSHMSTIEELLERKSSGSSLEIRAYCNRGSAALTTRYPLYPQKLALTSPTSGCHSVGIVCSRTQATEFVCLCYNTVFSCDLHPLFIPPTLLMAGGKEARSKQGLDFKSVTETISVHTQPPHNSPLVLSTHATHQELHSLLKLPFLAISTTFLLV